MLMNARGILLSFCSMTAWGYSKMDFQFAQFFFPSYLALKNNEFDRKVWAEGYHLSIHQFSLISLHGNFHKWAKSTE